MLAKLLIFGSFVALFSPISALAQEECDLTRDDLSSAINLKQKYYESNGAAKYKEQSVTQTAVLKTGPTVTYSMGGCHHYSYQFTYSNLGRDLSTMTKKEIAELVVRLLNDTPTKGSKIYEKTIMIDAIQNSMSKGLITDTELVLQCGDATCDIYADENGHLAISYIFPL